MSASVTSIVIFGASGDLTARKLIPALYHLYVKNRLPDVFRIVGLARSALTDEEFRNKLHGGVQEFAEAYYSGEQWAAFSKNLYYQTFDLNDGDAYTACHHRLVELEGESANRLYYLAVSPRFFPGIIQLLGEHGMTEEVEGFRRVIVEKPYGRDLNSARDLTSLLHRHLNENQIYRIDHYLAKETVQNILVLRFGNAIFEPIWNRNYIDHVQITAAEKVDVGHRGGYYDQSGVLRDMFQNHLLQLLALVSMEAPSSFEADALRNEKVKALSAIRPYESAEVFDNLVVGQYAGYLETAEVSEDSRTPTYAALRLYLDNWRWKDVPFYLRSGKGLKDKATEIIIHFKTPPHVMFPLPAGEKIRSNSLAICIQPDEGLHLRFEAKVPDTQATMRSVDMDFHYEESFGGVSVPEAYERLLLNALSGDPALFTRADGIEAAWRIVDPLLKVCEAGRIETAEYSKGSWGPIEADEFIAREGRSWLFGCSHD